MAKTTWIDFEATLRSGTPIREFLPAYLTIRTANPVILLCCLCYRRPRTHGNTHREGEREGVAHTHRATNILYTQKCIQVHSTSNTTQHNTTQHITSHHITSHHTTTQHITSHHNNTQHSTAQQCATQQNTVQHSLMQHKQNTTAKHITIRNTTTHTT